MPNLADERVESVSDLYEELVFELRDVPGLSVFVVLGKMPESFRNRHPFVERLLGH